MHFYELCSVVGLMWGWLAIYINTMVTIIDGRWVYLFKKSLWRKKKGHATTAVSFCIVWCRFRQTIHTHIAPKWLAPSPKPAASKSRSLGLACCRCLVIRRPYEVRLCITWKRNLCSWDPMYFSVKKLKT